jgi:hypothetical protein
MAEDVTAKRANDLCMRLWGLLGAIDDGTVPSTAAMRYRVEGAITALAMIGGAPVDDLARCFRGRRGKPFSPLS